MKLNYHLGFLKNVMWWGGGGKPSTSTRYGRQESGEYKYDPSLYEPSQWPSWTEDYGDKGYGTSSGRRGGGGGTTYTPGEYTPYGYTGGSATYNFPELKSPDLAPISPTTYSNISSVITQPLSTIGGGYTPAQTQAPSLGQRLGGITGQTYAHGVPAIPGGYYTTTDLGAGQTAVSPLTGEPGANVWETTGKTLTPAAEAGERQSMWEQLTKGLGNMLGDNPLSIGMRLGSAAIPQAEPSYEAREKYGDIYGKIMGEGGITPIGQMGTETLGKILQRGGETLTPAGEIGAAKLGEMATGQGWTDLDQNRYDIAASQIDENLEIRLDQLEKYYAKFNALDSGEYREAVANLMKETDREKNKMLYEMQAKAMDRQFEAVAQSLNYEINTRQQELSAADRAITYDTQTVSRLFALAQEIGADEILRTNIKNKDYEALRKNLNTLAYAFDGGGEVKEDASGKLFDNFGRELSKEMISQLSK